MSTIFEKFSLQGKTAIVTGGPGLLGAEFCRTLAEAGANVVVADLNGQAAESVAAGLKQAGYSANGAAVDITRPDAVKELVERTVKMFGSLDILVNSAAIDPKFDPSHPGTNDGAFETFPLELWQQAINVNLTGAFLCSQVAAVAMLKQGSGSIINICSMYGLVGPDQRLYEKLGEEPRYKPAYYPVTKAGILGLTRYIATYYAGKGIRANALTPGGIYNGNDEEFLKNYSARAVMGRMARKDEMNGALLFLASDASSYMTGSNLVVDGGWTAW
jgi:Dehydrogenases with different specificities (related to short-chain alcohol dehydrogenases)